MVPQLVGTGFLMPNDYGSRGSLGGGRGGGEVLEGLKFFLADVRLGGT